MPLTDEQIRAMRDKAELFGLYVAPHEVQSVNCHELAELCTRVLKAEAMVKHGDIKDTADYLVEALEQQEKEALLERVKVLEDALRELAHQADSDHVSDTYVSARARKALEEGR